MAKTENERLFDLLRENNYKIDSYAYPDNAGSEEMSHVIMFMIYETSSNIKSGKSKVGSVIDRSTLLENNNPLAFNRSTTLRDQENAVSEKGKRNAGLSGKRRRINKVITLYMPEKNTVSYGTEYENIEPGLVTGSVIDKIKSASDSFKGDLEGLDNNTALSGVSGNDVGRALLQNVSGGLNDLVTLKTQIARNPNMEFLFRSVAPREFEFEFNFTPKSEKEARTIREIIQLFKIHSMPRVNSSNLAGVFYDLPAEFEILFISNGKENKFVHKISTSALSGIEIDYSAAGVNSKHPEIDLGNGDRGSPSTHTNLVLSFTELEIMSRQRMEEGF